MQDIAPPGTPPERPSHPHAPTAEEWASLTEAQRAAVVEALPAMMTEAEMVPPEGDPHSEAKEGIKSTLKEHFRRSGRRVYVASDLTVYYPGAPRFAPDVLAVVDVDPRPRMKWVVSHEQRGLDVVFEVHVAGDRQKDLVRNAALYARLGIPEYFVLDRGRRRLHGFRLTRASRTVYEQIPVAEQRMRCEQLGLDLALENDRIRFYVGNAMLLEMPEVVARLQQMTDDATRRAEEESQRAAQEAERAAQEAERAAQEAERARQLEGRVAALEAELAQRGGRTRE